MNVKEVYKNVICDVNKLKYIVKDGTMCKTTGSYIFNVPDDNPLCFILNIILYCKYIMQFDNGTMLSIFDNIFTQHYSNPVNGKTAKHFVGFFTTLNFADVFDTYEDFVNNPETDISDKQYIIFNYNSKYIVFFYYTTFKTVIKQPLLLELSCKVMTQFDQKALNMSLLNALYLTYSHISKTHNISAYLTYIYSEPYCLFDDAYKNFLSNVHKLNFDVPTIVEMIQKENFLPHKTSFLFNIDIDNKHYWIKTQMNVQGKETGEEGRINIKLKPVCGIFDLIGIKKVNYLINKESETKLDCYRKRVNIDYNTIKEAIRPIYAKYNINCDVLLNTQNGSKYTIVIRPNTAHTIAPTVYIILKYNIRNTLMSFVIDANISIDKSSYSLFYMTGVDSEKADILCDIAYQVTKILNSKRFRNTLAMTSYKYPHIVKLTKEHKDIDKLVKQRNMSLEDFIVKERYNHDIMPNSCS